MLLVLLVTDLTLGDSVDSILNRKDPCTYLCEKTPIGFPNVRVLALYNPE